MIDNQAAAEAAYSTHIEAGTPNDAALPAAIPDAPVQPEVKDAPKVEAKSDKPLSTRDTISKALDAAEAKDKVEADKAAKVEEKPAKVEQPVKGADAKVEDTKTQPDKADQSAAPAKADATGQDGAEKPRASEGRGPYEPPARFLPKEKELWGNVPNPVKAAVARLSQEHEQEVTQYRESHENWQKLSKFDTMAKQHNTSVSDALERYTAVDGLLNSNPIEGIRQVLATIGITPQQYAEFITKNPQAAQAPVQRAPDPQVQHQSTEIETLKSEITAMRHEQAARSIIDPFRAANPRYDELQDDIAFFLSSGKIPTSLPPQDRLEAAYDMAVRINPTSSVNQPEDRQELVDVSRVPPSDAGTKSVRGAPDSGISQDKGKASKNNRDAVRRALDGLGI